MAISGKGQTALPSYSCKNPTPWARSRLTCGTGMFITWPVSCPVPRGGFAMSRWFFMIVLASVCTGCLGYVYPTLTHTPELAVENRDGSVHAFRVDIDRTDRKPLQPITQYTLTNIPL